MLRTGFLVVAGVAVIACAALWIQQVAIAFPLTILIAAGLAYLAWWHAPMNDWAGEGLFPDVDLQSATYTRLQRKHGEDWDLNTSVEAFDLERRKAVLEAKLNHVLRYTATTLPVPVVIWTMMLFTRADVFPVMMFLSYGTGLLLINLVLQITLRIQLRENRRKIAAKKREKQAKGQITTQQGSTLSPYSKFTMGDDGELIEQHKQQQKASHRR